MLGFGRVSGERTRHDAGCSLLMVYFADEGPFNAHECIPSRCPILDCSVALS